MIRINYWPDAVTAWGRESWVQAFEPGKVSDLIPEHVGRDHLIMLRNGAVASPDDEYADGDFIDFAFRPMDLVSIGLSILISTAITFAIRALLPPPEPAKQRSDDRSPTHGFNRMQNIRVEGTPIPVVYGEHRVPGTIINEFVEVDNGKGSATYFALICVSEGDIFAIADEAKDTPALKPLRSDSDTVPNGIFLQGNTLANFAGIEAWVRLGTNQQDVIPGFERAKQTFSVDVTLNAPAEGVSSGNDHIDVNDYALNTSAIEAHWEEWGFAYDTVVEQVDGLEVVLNFPNGLFKIDPSSGNIEVSRFVLGIRFAKLDDNGNVIVGPGNGGNQDDGWVRLPFHEIVLDRQSAFQVSFPTWLYDPSTFIGEVPGDALHVGTWSDTSDSYFRTATDLDTAHRPDNWPSDSETADTFTFECWVAFDRTGGDGPFDGPGGHLAMMEWSSDGNDNGVWFGFRIREVLLPGGGSRWAWRPKVQIGRWSRLYEWPEIEIVGTTDANAKIWYHFVWTHKRFGSSSNRTEFYVNGVSKGHWIENADIIVPRGALPAARIDFGFSNNIINTDWSVKGWWDEVVVSRLYYNSDRVALRYNGGQGLRGAQGDTNVVVGYRFDGLSGTQGPVSYGGATAQPNDGQLTGSGAVPTYVADGGIVSVFESPPRVRGKYRVQCVRTNGLPSPGGARHQGIADWSLAVTWLDEAFCFPNAAILGISVPATDQLNSSAPTITSIVKGRVLPIWDRVSLIAPAFSRKFTRNPAWVILDMATNERYGGRQAFQIENVDLASTADFADHCDKRVYDGKGRRYFYRQEFEDNANICNSPNAIDAFWSFAFGAPVVTQNTAEAPDGSLTADTISDQNNSFVAGRGFSAGSGSAEDGWYSASMFVKKDTTATATSAMIRILFGADVVDYVFSIDTGEAVQGCSVEDYSDDWWLIRTDPYYWNKGTASITFQIHPATYAHGDATTEVASLQEEITVWGVNFSRDKDPLVYPAGEFPRTFIYMADKDLDGAAQVIPSHWVVGGELAISGAGDSDWDTPSGLTKNLEITQIRTRDDFDGYERVWIISAVWYDTDTDTHPASTFPDMLINGRDWALPITEWWTTNSGFTYVPEFDDGVNGGPPGPTLPLPGGAGNGNADPLQRTVLNVEGLTPSTVEIIVEQSITAPGSGSRRVRARGLLFKHVTHDINIELIQSGGGVGGASHLGDTSTWEAVEAELDITSSFEFRINVNTGAQLNETWFAGLGCWLAVDENGAEPGGTIGGAEALFEYDAVHDDFTNLWETLVAACATARAVPIQEGNRLRFKPEKSRSPVGLVTMAATVRTGEDGEESTFRLKYTNTRERPNSISIDFHDQDKNWERSPASRDDPTIEELGDAGSVRRQSFFLKGATRRSQVLRHIDFMLNVNRSITREGGFTTGPSSVTFEPGDVVALAHDLVPWGTSGRALHTSAPPDTTNLLMGEVESFAGWTPSNSGAIVVTENVVAGPFGEPNGVKVEAVADSQLSLIHFQSGIDAGVDYTFSFRVKRRHDEGKVGVLMRQSGSGVDLSIWEYEWATGILDQTLGVSGRAESVTDEGGGWFRIACNLQTNNESDIEIQLIIERVPAKFLGAAIYLADPQIESGTEEPGGYVRPGSGLHLDRDVTLEQGETYSVRVTSAVTGVTDTSVTTTPAGAYLRGDKLNIPDLSFAPAKGDEYIVYTETERFLAQIAAVRLNGDDTSIDVDWVEYDDTIYDSDELSEDIDVSASTVNDGDRLDLQFNNTIPNPVQSMQVVEATTAGRGGMPHIRAEVSWDHDEETVQHVQETRIYVSYLDPDTQEHNTLRLVATAPGKSQVATFALPDEQHGREITVAAQAVGYGGVALSPESSQSQTRVLQAFAPAPDTPTGLVAHMEGDKIVFDWTHVANHDGVTYEIRLGMAESRGGGWVLAQKVGETRDNRFGPSSLWATGPGAQDPVYYMRARNRQGTYSGVISIQYSARVANTTILTASNHWYAFINQAWASYGDGWVTDSGPPFYDPTLTNLQRHADGYLHFTDGPVTGTYETAGIPSSPLPDYFQREERLYIEAVVGATCRDPEEIGLGRSNGDGTFRFSVAALEDQIGWPLTDTETIEGRLASTDLPTLTIQMRLIRDQGAAGSPPSTLGEVNSAGDPGWLDYRPGIFQCHGAEFRLLVTRPNADWDVRISHFSTRCVREVDQRHYLTPVESLLAAEVF